MRLLPLAFILFCCLLSGCSKKEPVYYLIPNYDTLEFSELKKVFFLSRTVVIENNIRTMSEFGKVEVTYESGTTFRKYDLGDIYCDGRKMIFLDWGRVPIFVYISSPENVDSFLSGDNNVWELKGNDRFSPVTYQDPSHFPVFTTPLPDTVDRTEVMTISITHAVGFDVYITGIDTPVNRIIKVVDSIVNIPDSVLSALPQNSKIKIKAYSEVINTADGANFSKVSTWEKPLWIR